MKYLQSSFTLPASTGKQVDWDLAFMSDADFTKKYGMTKEEYGRGISQPVRG